VGNVVLESGVKWFTLFGAGALCIRPAMRRMKRLTAEKAVYILNYLCDGSMLREMTLPRLEWR
jgi:hypothetical protein